MRTFYSKSLIAEPQTTEVSTEEPIKAPEAPEEIKETPGESVKLGDNISSTVASRWKELEIDINSPDANIAKNAREELGDLENIKGLDKYLLDFNDVTNNIGWQEHDEMKSNYGKTIGFAKEKLETDVILEKGKAQIQDDIRKTVNLVEQAEKDMLHVDEKIKEIYDLAEKRNIKNYDRKYYSRYSNNQVELFVADYRLLYRFMAMLLGRIEGGGVVAKEIYESDTGQLMVNTTNELLDKYRSSSKFRFDFTKGQLTGIKRIGEDPKEEEFIKRVRNDLLKYLLNSEVKDTITEYVTEYLNSRGIETVTTELEPLLKLDSAKFEKRIRQYTPDTITALQELYKKFQGAQLLETKTIDLKTFKYPSISKMFTVDISNRNRILDSLIFLYADELSMDSLFINYSDDEYNDNVLRLIDKLKKGLTGPVDESIFERVVEKYLSKNMIEDTLELDGPLVSLDDGDVVVSDEAKAFLSGKLRKLKKPGKIPTKLEEEIKVYFQTILNRIDSIRIDKDLANFGKEIDDLVSNLRNKTLKEKLQDLNKDTVDSIFNAHLGAVARHLREQSQKIRERFSKIDEFITNYQKKLEVESQKISNSTSVTDFDTVSTEIAKLESEIYKKIQDLMDKKIVLQESEVISILEKLTSVKNKLLTKTGNMENAMQKESKYFHLFQNSDKSGGYWDLNKESGKIVKLPKSRKESMAQNKDKEMIKKSFKDGGVWKYSKGDQVSVDTDFGFINATIDTLLPGGQYILKNDTHLKDGIQVAEQEIFDPSVSI